jgi:hypothetical protein
MSSKVVYLIGLLACLVNCKRQMAITSIPQEVYHTNAPWLDTDGHPINAHGAGVLLHDGTYYLYGELKAGKTELVPGQNWEAYRVAAGGVNCYSSHDLVHWHKEGRVLAPDTTDATSDLHVSKVIERPKVIYNEQTKLFVMWLHIDTQDYSYSQAGMATSTSPTGPFTYRGSVKPNGYTAHDLTLFKDDDGRAYLLFTSESNQTMHIAQLSDDYLSPTTKEKSILVNKRREAPALFKHDGAYYLITSDCTGWNPSPATYAVADSPLGDWQQQGNPCIGAGAETTFQSQSTFVLPLVDHPDDFLFMADRWNKTDLSNSQYSWLPLHMANGQPEIRDTAH